MTTYPFPQHLLSTNTPPASPFPFPHRIPKIPLLSGSLHYHHLPRLPRSHSVFYTTQTHAGPLCACTVQILVLEPHILFDFKPLLPMGPKSQHLHRYPPSLPTCIGQRPCVYVQHGGKRQKCLPGLKSSCRVLVRGSRGDGSRGEGGAVLPTTDHAF